MDYSHFTEYFSLKEIESDSTDFFNEDLTMRDSLSDNDFNN